MMDHIKMWAKQLKRKVIILYFAYKDHRTPWYAKVFAVCVVAYAFSPIDLIPDFIPLLGYLDDLILIPLGVVIAWRMMPNEVIEECTEKAELRAKEGKPRNWIAGSFIILVWVLAFLWMVKLAYRHLFNG